MYALTTELFDYYLQMHKFMCYHFRKKWLPEPLRKLSRHKGKKSRNKEGLAAVSFFGKLWFLSSSSIFFVKYVSSILKQTKGSQDNISPATTQPTEEAAKLELESEIKVDSTVLDELDNSNSIQTPNLENFDLEKFYAPDIVTESETDADSAAEMSSSNVDIEKVCSHRSCMKLYCGIFGRQS
jgi:hypothetical protein